jgi:hypothetical protein
VAPAETASAPPEAVQSSAKENVALPAPSFGNGRGSGLARGKRGLSPATAATKSAPEGSYKPTAIQVVTAEREYKNPFTPEQPVAPEQSITIATAPETVLPISTAPSSSAAPAPTAAETRSPINPTSATSLAPARDAFALPDEKAELNILPPEDRPRPSQSWESSSFPPQTAAPDSRPARREDRPTFRVERRDGRVADPRPTESRPDESRPSQENPGDPRSNGPRRDDRNGSFRRDGRPGEPRGERRDFREGRENRDGRGNREPRENRDGQPRREPRPFEQRPSPPPQAATPVEPKRGGFLGWLKGLFAEDKPAPEKIAEQPVNQEARRPEGEQRPRPNRGSRGEFRGQNRGEYRGPNRGENRGPVEGGQSTGEGSGEFNGGGGQRRRRHRGGRGRGGFQDNRGGDNRPENGGGPTDV